MSVEEKRVATKSTTKKGKDKKTCENVVNNYNADVKITKLEVFSIKNHPYKSPNFVLVENTGDMLPYGS